LNTRRPAPGRSAHIRSPNRSRRGLRLRPGSPLWRLRAAFRPLPVRLAAGVVLLLLAAWISGRFEAGPPTSKVREARPSITPAPPVTDARWQGLWEFAYTLTNLEGVGEDGSDFDVGARIRRVWDVNPQCDDGPCSVEISAIDPDNPSSEPISTFVSYEEGVYRTSQTFPPVQGAVCRGADGNAIQGQFEAANLVEVVPTRAEATDGGTVVSELQATKTTIFRPIGAAKAAGGDCNLKRAIWVAKVTPVE
jgi:hypothetical protein